MSTEVINPIPPKDTPEHRTLFPGYYDARNGMLCSKENKDMEDWVYDAFSKPSAQYHYNKNYRTDKGRVLVLYHAKYPNHTFHVPFALILENKSKEANSTLIKDYIELTSGLNLKMNENKQGQEPKIEEMPEDKTEMDIMPDENPDDGPLQEFPYRIENEERYIIRRMLDFLEKHTELYNADDDQEKTIDWDKPNPPKWHTEFYTKETDNAMYGLILLCNMLGVKVPHHAGNSAFVNESTAKNYNKHDFRKCFGISEDNTGWGPGEEEAHEAEFASIV